MNLQILSKEDLRRWIAALVADFRVIGPRKREDPVLISRNGDRRPEDAVIFAEVQEGEELELAYRSTILAPKKLFLPQQETLFTFRDGGGHIEVELDERPTVIFGLHTCDLHAMMLLDAVLSRNGADAHYQARRAKATLVSIECQEPCSEHAFCKDMGTWLLPEDFDVHLTDLGTAYALQTGSAKGVELLAGAPGLRPAQIQEWQRFKQLRQAKWSRFPYRLTASTGELPGLLAASTRSQYWTELGEKCLSCGSCTAVCPTCFCFDVRDELDLDLSSGRRVRIWDSCQFSQFATVAGGHDFRGSPAARLRHRFAHKYQYQAQEAGLTACVGCGRCASACLVNIDPVQVLNTLQQKRVSAAGKRQGVRK